MNKSVLLLPFFMLACSLVVGQTDSIDRKFSKAEELRKNYRFKEAAGVYKEIISETSDTNYHREILSLIAKCENGTNMLNFASTPKVLGSAEVPYVDFFLNYNYMPIRMEAQNEMHATGIFLIEIGVAICVMMTIINLLDAIVKRGEEHGRTE